MVFALILDPENDWSKFKKYCPSFYGNKGRPWNNFKWFLRYYFISSSHSQRLHIKKFLWNRKELVICKDCDLVFCLSWTLGEHLRHHHGSGYFVWLTLSRPGPALHLNITLSERKTHAWKLCNEMFKTRSKTEKHMRFEQRILKVMTFLLLSYFIIIISHAFEYHTK